MFITLFISSLWSSNLLSTHGSWDPSYLTVSQLFLPYQLLIPHFRYTMEINMLARSNLVSEWGIFDLVWRGMGKEGGRYKDEEIHFPIPP